MSRHSSHDFTYATQEPSRNELQAHSSPARKRFAAPVAAFLFVVAACVAALLVQVWK